MNKNKLFQKLNYTPHSDAQQQVHDSTARFRVPCCGRRWGKSISAGREMTAAVIDASKPGSYYWIVGPTYALGEKEFRVVFHDLKTLGIIDQVKKSYTAKTGDMRIEMPWGTILEVKSADKPDSLVGEGLDGVIMSEAAKHKRDTWERYVEPALSDKRGWAIFPSTPEGFNWYQGIWQLGQLGSYPEYASWRLPTWTNTVMYPGGRQDTEITRIEQNVSKAWFDQEYGAEFTSFEGQIYDEWDESIHCRPIEYEPSWRNYWGIDFGFTNPFVCLDIMVDPSDNVYVWREYVVRNQTNYEHGLSLRERDNPEGYHVDAAFADPRDPDGIATLNSLLGNVYGRPVGWKLGIESVKRYLKVQADGLPKLFIDKEACPELSRQMPALRKPPEKEGRGEPEGQWKFDDHGPDALRYFFSEYYVLGAGTSLSDIYDQTYRGSEAESFFQYHGNFTL